MEMLKIQLQDAGRIGEEKKDPLLIYPPSLAQIQVLRMISTQESEPTVDTGLLKPEKLKIRNASPGRLFISVPTVGSDPCSCLTGVEPHVDFCSSIPSTLRFYMLYVV